ncbi:hypothetical protein CFC21_027517 [Triticum aestivum]|uniref:Ribosome-binding factor A n=3 Tax=Triticinae TaxID=1648030 RepID=A0A3B6D5C3_WHEAT|nr:hypothetical protein CFC21_027517 [Triticum aestivum]
MVAKQIPRELADMLTRDPIMQRAVLPEAALGADHYLSSLTTIADVELSNDLQVTPGPSLETMRLRCNLGWLVVGGDAELLVSASVCVCRCARCMCLCLGTRGGRKWPWPGSRTRPVRSQIGKRMKLRLTPKIWFIEDESMERGSRILTILDKLKEEREQREGNVEEEDVEVSDIAEEEDGVWEGDEPDEEDIIYVK